MRKVIYRLTEESDFQPGYFHCWAGTMQDAYSLVEDAKTGNMHRLNDNQFKFIFPPEESGPQNIDVGPITAYLNAMTEFYKSFPVETKLTAYRNPDYLDPAIEVLHRWRTAELLALGLKLDESGKVWCKGQERILNDELIYKSTNEDWIYFTSQIREGEAIKPDRYQNYFFFGNPCG